MRSMLDLKSGEVNLQANREREFTGCRAANARETRSGTIFAVERSSPPSNAIRELGVSLLPFFNPEDAEVRREIPSVRSRLCDPLRLCVLCV